MNRTEKDTFPAEKPHTFNQKVYDIVRQIPRGKVLSYGKIARLTGSFRASRAVGYAVAAPNAPRLPYHRVVYKDGSLSAAFMQRGNNRQYALLKAEGVAFTRDKRVHMKKHEWDAGGITRALFKKYGL